jgi:hypothetical protein
MGGKIAAGQVERLLDQLPVDGEVPQDLAWQCQLISLVSDAVTLRADRIESDDDGASAGRRGPVTRSSVPAVERVAVYVEPEVRQVPGHSLERARAP